MWPSHNVSSLLQKVHGNVQCPCQQCKGSLISEIFASAPSCQKVWQITIPNFFSSGHRDLEHFLGGFQEKRSEIKPPLPTYILFF